MKNRRLKVREGYYDLPKLRQDEYSGICRTDPKVPFILLKGYWLEKANFRIDNPVHVEVRENQQILTIPPHQ